MVKGHAAQGAAEGTAMQGIAGGYDQSTGGPDTPMFNPFATGMGAAFGGLMGGGASVGTKFRDSKLYDLYGQHGVPYENLQTGISSMMQGKGFLWRSTKTSSPRSKRSLPPVRAQPTLIWRT
jgi:hypothetical protein